MIRFVLIILLIISIYYTILAIIDVVRTGRNVLLIPLLILTSVIGAIIYFMSKEEESGKSKINF
jgi:hypothetical protein